MTSAPRGHDRLRHRLSLPPSDRSGPALRRPVVLLVLLVALLALPAIPTRELMPTDEPRFALVARQMVEDPAPIVPHLGYDPLTHEGEVYGDKPPVFFWLISLFSFLTGGVGEISARLPSFIASIAAVLLTYRIGRLLAGEAAGLAAGAILATSNQFFLRAGWCSIDMVLTALTLAATYCWLMAPKRPPDGALDVSLAVQRHPERVHHPAEVGVADRDRQHLAGPADLLAFLDLGEVAEDDHADLADVQVEREAADPARELQQLVGHR